jgi:hypothetical protein
VKDVKPEENLAVATKQRLRRMQLLFHWEMEWVCAGMHPKTVLKVKEGG